MSRRERQLDEMHDLCTGGSVRRAIDLAFEHLACFGRDDVLLGLLTEIVGRPGTDELVRRRLVELLAAQA